MRKKTKILFGILGGITLYTIGMHIYDYYIRKEQVLTEARAYSASTGKPLLNVGSSCYCVGDINLDIINSGCCPNFVQGTIEDLSMFTDKQFGAVFASHVLEHTEDPDKALAEMNRVADNVFLVLPSWFNPFAWLTPEHKWVFWDHDNLNERTMIRG